MEPRFHGPERDLECIRDLAVTQALEVCKQQNLPKGPWQFINRTLYEAALLLFVHGRAGLGNIDLHQVNERASAGPV